MSQPFSKIKHPILLILALLLMLGMLRLGVWQLDRAEQKQLILDQVNFRSQQAAIDMSDKKLIDVELDRYRKVMLKGTYLSDKTIYIDNQVINGQVGYLVFTPFMSADQSYTVMVNRGWVSVGESRAKLPEVSTPAGIQSLAGRLNLPPAQPPYWNDNYPVAQGKLWAYLPLDEYASQMQLSLSPLVVELAPENAADSQFVIQWAEINDEWVAKHQGYAFQWFAMALAFLIACLILLIRQRKQN